MGIQSSKVTNGVVTGPAGIAVSKASVGVVIAVFGSLAVPKVNMGVVVDTAPKANRRRQLIVS